MTPAHCTQGVHSNCQWLTELFSVIGEKGWD